MEWSFMIEIQLFLIFAFLHRNLLLHIYLIFFALH